MAKPQRGLAKAERDIEAYADKFDAAVAHETAKTEEAKRLKAELADTDAREDARSKRNEDIIAITHSAIASADIVLSQAEKFAQAARDLGADQDEKAFKGVLRKLAKPKM